MAAANGGEASGSQWKDGEALYAITTQLRALPETFGSYIALTRALDREAELELHAALELPGRALAVAPAGARVLYVLEAEAPLLTRHAVAQDGGFERQDALSFAAHGVSFAPSATMAARSSDMPCWATRTSARRRSSEASIGSPLRSRRSRPLAERRVSIRATEHPRLDKIPSSGRSAF